MLNVQTQEDESESKERKNENKLRRFCQNFKEHLAEREVTVIMWIITLTAIALLTSTIVLKSSTYFGEHLCETFEELQSLDIKVPCRYDDVKKISSRIDTICAPSFGIELLTVMYVGIVQLSKCVRSGRCVFGCICIICLYNIVLGFVLYHNHTESKQQQTSMNFTSLKILMMTSLKNHYTSEWISYTSIGLTDKWNNFFIEHDCCGVNSVSGPNNDFDETPWCTASQTCQEKNSQIPMTCCRDVTKGDYFHARSDCFTALKFGTYKKGCFIHVKEKMLDDDKEVKNKLLNFRSKLEGVMILRFISAGSDLFALICVLTAPYRKSTNQEKSTVKESYIPLQEVVIEETEPQKDEFASNRIEDSHQSFLQIKEDVSANSIIWSYTFLNFLFVVTLAVLLPWSENEDYERSCDIKEALQLLKANFKVSCKNDNVKQILDNIWRISTPCLVCDFLWILFGLIIKLTTPKKRNRIFIATYYSTMALLGLIFGSLFLELKADIVDSNARYSDINYGDVKTFMNKSLQERYTSDMITDGKSMSDRWNTFFIKYECCAVNQVTGLDNDFDTTPWCTTSGSCREMSSQIPKTCCKDVTEDNYNNAGASCHAAVSSGTFKDGCFSQVKKLNDETMTDNDVDFFSSALMTIGIFKIISSIFLVICFGWFIWGVIHEKKKMYRKDERILFPECCSCVMEN